MFPFADRERCFLCFLNINACTHTFSKVLKQYTEISSISLRYRFEQKKKFKI